MTLAGLTPSEIQARLERAGWTLGFIRESALTIVGQPDPGVISGSAIDGNLLGWFRYLPDCADGDFVDRIERPPSGAVSHRAGPAKLWACVLDGDLGLTELVALAAPGEPTTTEAALVQALIDRGWIVDRSHEETYDDWSLQIGAHRPGAELEVDIRSASKLTGAPAIVDGVARGLAGSCGVTVRAYSLRSAERLLEALAARGPEPGSR